MLCRKQALGLALAAAGAGFLVSAIIASSVLAVLLGAALIVIGCVVGRRG